MKRVPLRYLCAPSLRPVNSDSGMPYVGLECVEPRSGSLRNHDLPRHESQHALLAPSGSVIFGKLRPYLGKSLRVARPLAVSPEFLVLIPAQAMDARFLAYLARSYDFMSAAVESVEGVKMPRTSWSLLRDFAAWSPERSAQEAIGEILDRECEKVAQLTGRLETLASCAEEPLLAELHRSVAGWPKGRIGYRFEVQLGKMLDEKRVDHSQLAPYLRNANVHWDRLVMTDVKSMSFDESERRRFRLVPGDLLVCEGGEPGRATVWDGSLAECYYQKALHRVRPRSEDSTRFLLWCLRLLASRGAFAADGPGRYTHLTAEELRATKIPLPPVDVQNDIVARIDSRGRAARSLRDRCIDAIDRLAEYRDALITEAVTGQLDVTRLSDSQLDESAHAAVEGERPEVLSA